MVTNIPDGNDPNNPVRIYTDGVFDWFHYGHARLMEQAKKKFKHVYLLAGVTSDEDTLREKGKLLMRAKERVECVKNCKWVDEVIEDCPWICDLEFFKKNNIHYLAHEPSPYRYGEVEDIYKIFKDENILLPTQRIGSISTTDLIVRIFRNYEEFVNRSIKKGMEFEELNIERTIKFIIQTLLNDNSEESKKTLLEIKNLLEDKI